MIERIKDRWLTWRTGKDKATRDYEAWYDINVNLRSHYIQDMFKNFEHVITVDPAKFMDPHEPFGWVPCEKAREYFWPQRALGENCVWRFERVSRDQWNNRLLIEGFLGEDRVFVATNNSKDAMMIALQWG